MCNLKPTANEIARVTARAVSGELIVVQDLTGYNLVVLGCHHQQERYHRVFVLPDVVFRKQQRHITFSSYDQIVSRWIHRSYLEKVVRIHRCK